MTELDPISATLLCSFVALIFMFWRILTRADKSVSGSVLICLSGLFVISPVVLLGSTSKILYFGDFIGLFFLVRWIFRDDSFFGRVTGNKFIFLVFLLLVFLPILMTIMAVFFTDTNSVVRGLPDLFRSIVAFLIFENAFTQMQRDRRIGEEVLQVGKYVFLVILGFGAGQFLFGFSTDILSVYGDSESITSYNEGFGGGSVGLWRGDLGGILGSISAVYFSMAIRSHKFLPLELFGVAMSALVLAGIGSRQGILVFVVFLFVLSVFSVIFLPVGKKIKALVFVVFFIASVYYYSISNPLIVDWLVARFDIFSTGLSASDLVVDERDPRIRLIMDKLVDNPLFYLFGGGYSALSTDYSSDVGRLIYVDSEFLLVSQRLGLVGILIYISSLVYVLVLSFKHLILRKNLYYFSIFLFFFSSFMFLFGHFSLMNFSVAHASVAYLYWLILAYLLNLISLAKQRNASGS